MKPPYYQTLLEALSRKDRNGLSVVDPEAESIRKMCLETSDYKQMNRDRWAEFVLRNPSDRAAIYMREFVL